MGTGTPGSSRDRLAFTPYERDGERVNAFKGKGAILPVIAGSVWFPPLLDLEGVIVKPLMTTT
jgi:hypothetical protein